MNATFDTITDAHAAGRDALLERIVESAAAMFNICAIHVGDQLGLYEAMAQSRFVTATELAERTGANERYVREWLEQQTVNGIVEVEDASAPASSRRYRLPSGHAEALAESESLNFIAPLAQVAVGAASALDRLTEVFRTGEGIPFEGFGRHLREGQARQYALEAGFQDVEIPPIENFFFRFYRLRG